MHNAPIAGAELHFGSVFFLRGVQRNHKTAEHIRSLGWQRIGLRHCNYLVGLPDLPTASELRGRGLLPGVAFRSAVSGPLADDRDLLIGETALILEVSISRLGLPRRHEMRLCDGGDLLGALGGILISQERKGCNLARMMATAAVLVQNGRNVAIKGRRGRRIGFSGECSPAASLPMRRSIKSESVAS